MAGAADAQDRDTQLLIAVIGAFILISLVFWFFHDPLVFGVLKLAQAKLWLAGLVYPPYAEYADKLSGLALDDPRIDEMTKAQAFSILNEAARPFAIAVALVFAGIGIKALVTNPLMRYRREFTAEQLLENNARNFPAVRPVVGLRLHKTPAFEGPWRVAEDYIRFALRHRLIERRIGKDLIPDSGDPEADAARTVRIGKHHYRRGEWVRAYHVHKAKGERKVRAVKDPVHYARERVEDHRFDRARAEVAMIGQLGMPLYEGGKARITRWREWPPQHRALMAAFLLIGFGPGKRVGREAGMEMLNRFNTSFYHPDWRKKGKPPIRIEDLDMTGVDQVLSAYLGVKYRLAKGEEPYDFPRPEKGRKTVNNIRKKLLLKHAYLNTLMIRLLMAARERGILVTSDFIWVRPIDRALFYTLNNVGRNNVKNATGLVEGSGSMAHFMVEESLDSACIPPEVGKAVDGLEKGLISEGWLLPEKENRRRRQ